MTIGLEEAIRYTKAAIKHAQESGTVTYGCDKQKAYFIDESRILALEKALVTLEAVHLSVELECPKFRELYSEQLEKDDFIADRFEVQRCINEAQLIDKDAKDAYKDHLGSYNGWLDGRGLE